MNPDISSPERVTVRIPTAADEEIHTGPPYPRGHPTHLYIGVAY
jgi:hypothetical protein